MTARLLEGVRTWNGSRDKEGQREFNVVQLVETTDKSDGPFTVMQTPGLLLPGMSFNFGNDTDLWAFCTPEMKVSIHKEKEGHPSYFWRVEQKFSTRPMKRCQDYKVEDPLLEPMKISGSFVKYKKAAVKSRFNQPVLTSSHERFPDASVEFDHNHPTVKIEFNVPSLGLDVFSQMINCVNDDALWGLPRRCVKLSNVTWERKPYAGCDYYYTRAFDFDVDYNTFDRELLDEGTKALSGRWADGLGTGETGWVLINVDGHSPNSENPLHFNRVKDRNGENMRVILNGAGVPANSKVFHNVELGTGSGGSGGPGKISLEYYEEANFLELGVPTEF